jgi:rare lipoprotein A
MKMKPLDLNAIRSKVFMTWAALRWCLLMFFIAPVLNAPAIGVPGNSPHLGYNGARTLAAAGLATPNPALTGKPLQSFNCVSSWYGEDFDGQPTASGEVYDMYADTAAHPTLPLGTMVRVINLRTHRSAVVRINDRGPYVEGRNLDVSFEVARRLGFDQRGTAEVRVELLKVPSRRPAPNDQPID